MIFDLNGQPCANSCTQLSDCDAKIIDCCGPPVSIEQSIRCTHTFKKKDNRSHTFGTTQNPNGVDVRQTINNWGGWCDALQVSDPSNLNVQPILNFTIFDSANLCNYR